MPSVDLSDMFHPLGRYIMAALLVVSVPIWIASAAVRIRAQERVTGALRQLSLVASLLVGLFGVVATILAAASLVLSISDEIFEVPVALVCFGVCVLNTLAAGVVFFHVKDRRAVPT